MKIQIAFDFLDLSQALETAEKVQDYCDVFEVGTLLIYKHGENAVRSFKEKFSQKTILADAKIVDQGKEATQIFSLSGADWITVMGGTNKHVIHKATQRAHELDKKVMLDMLDVKSVGQSALEAKDLGTDALLFHPTISENTQTTFIDQWNLLKGNTDLPIFISAYQDTLDEIISVKPYGIVFGAIITKEDNPEEKAKELFELVNNPIKNESNPCN